jgi:hypothetical protein
VYVPFEANRLIDFFEGGIQHAKEASGIFERLGDTANQAECLINLAYASRCGKQLLDAAEELKPHPTVRSVFSQRKANSFWFATVTLSLVIYITPSARQRRPCEPE